MTEQEANDHITPLQAEVKAEWVRRLRSGEYEQGHCRLVTYDEDADKTSYCCLGVLALVCALDSSSSYFLRDKAGNPVLVPFTVQQELGQMNDGSLITETGIIKAANTFAEIADYIEANDGI